MNQIKCPRCHAAVKVADAVVGDDVNCPECQHHFTIGDQSPPRRSWWRRFLRAIGVSALVAFDFEDVRPVAPLPPLWIAAPLTLGGVILSVVGALIAIFSALGLLATNGEYSFPLREEVVDLGDILSALKCGFFFLAGLIIFATGAICRSVRNE